MRILVLAGLLISTPVLALGGDRVQKDIGYSDAGGDRTRLDVYAPAEGKDHPVVIWVHGGAWQLGDKRVVQAKPRAFNEQGYVLVSVNYRLFPKATHKDQAGDIAQAVRWVHEHAADHGGDAKRIFLMGHSAGAHLVALAGTDPRYLENAGLRLSDLSGVILLDGAGYNIPQEVRGAFLPRLKTMYTQVFSEDEAKQREASPITHVVKDRGIPPFLILHVASRRDSTAQSQALAGKLREAGVEAKVVPAHGKSHLTINRELGEPEDGPTREVFEFLKTQSHKPRKS